MSQVSSGNALMTYPSTTATVVTTGSSPSLAAITATTGLTLPATGGTPTQITFYETYSTASTYTGIWASSQSCTINVERVNNKVTICGTQGFATANTAAVVTLSYTIPARFQPSGGLARNPCSIINNSTIGIGLVQIGYASAGVITIVTSTAGNFTGSSSGGCHSWTLTYFV